MLASLVCWSKCMSSSKACLNQNAEPTQQPLPPNCYQLSCGMQHVVHYFYATTLWLPCGLLICAGPITMTVLVVANCGPCKQSADTPVRYRSSSQHTCWWCLVLQVVACLMRVPQFQLLRSTQPLPMKPSHWGHTAVQWMRQVGGFKAQPVQGCVLLTPAYNCIYAVLLAVA
jgi:hypothetical protein